MAFRSCRISSSISAGPFGFRGLAQEQSPSTDIVQRNMIIVDFNLIILDAGIIFGYKFTNLSRIVQVNRETLCNFAGKIEDIS